MCFVVSSELAYGTHSKLTQELYNLYSVDMCEDRAATNLKLMGQNLSVGFQIVCINLHQHANSLNNE
jgi:hypothetical protein